MFRALYDRALHWSRHRYAERYLAALSLAEATVFPIPPDVMLAPMVLARRDRAWRLALLTTLTSVLGGLIGYLIGHLALDAIYPFIERVGYAHHYERAVDAFRDYGIWFVIIAGFTPIPFKIITIAGGALGMPLLGFVAGSLIGRGARFYLVAGLVWAGGARAEERLREWVDLIGWSVLIIAAVAGLVWWWL
ncbi:YqaA family protein [Wenzhouxiangella marina]|uniref:Membrane protein n=1 Tax=Wenzhouxiangella marina TaxID=1579979 RepID=A0A0K0XVE8_9GAMM|nr:YqaA family protein [Wenzhouxiangella marina]AKS41684.1 membrane protein [Wenzhouxiangella marina]MBB6086555.1 membrane protein YqaA with SNARE-associated domain [Wenzhouxiangella marina]